MDTVTSAPARTLNGRVWTHPFAALGRAFHTPLAPTPLPAPHAVAHSRAMAQELDLDEEWLASAEATAQLSGNALPAGSAPLASVYSGHQFGHWAGQLGDGRAILLGEVRGRGGIGWELQLKGAGRTPYSRMGDGRAVLRSSIREFLASEALHALGIPTTRALAITGSPAPVVRETTETAAVVTRAAPSFIRFGHFEHFAAADNRPALQALTDHVIDRFYPECRAGDGFGGNAAAALLAAVTGRTAHLLAHWQAVGFCHGVMNTDNMSILGLTIDYGPFQFMDGFDPGHICNHSDPQGRYAYNRQPAIAYWNLFALAQALMPLIETPDLAMAALEPFRDLFAAALQTRMNARLGLPAPQPGDHALVEGTLAQLAAQRVDYTAFWRRLAEHQAGASLEPVRDLFPDRAAFDAWMLQYSEQTKTIPRWEMAQLMLKTSPRIVLRNHLAEQAIQAARQGDFSEVRRLHRALETPFEPLAGADPDAALPPDWAAQLQISCSS
jgi:uncharacterized protein YdiU (UPF0061 family)